MTTQLSPGALHTHPAGVLERVSDGVVGLDLEWRYMYLNESAARQLRMPPARIIGQTIWALFPETVARPFWTAMQRAMATQEVTYVQDYYPPLQGWFEVRIYPSPDGLTMFFHNITEHRRVEALLRGQSRVLEMIAHGAALQDSLEALLRLFEGLSEGMRCSVLLLDSDGKHLCHGAAASLPASLTHSLAGTAVGPHAGSCGAAASLRKPVFVEDIASDPNWNESSALALSLGLRACWSTPIFDDEQTLLGTFAVYYDESVLPDSNDKSLVEMATHIAAIAISRERADEERIEQERTRQQYRELEASTRTAEATSRLKSEFLATMSHELRTPLHAILGFAEYLLDQSAGPLVAKQSEYLQYVLSSGQHLLRLVDDVLDLAKCEAGKLELFPREFLLNELLAEVSAVVGELARKKHISLRVRCDPERVTLDAQRLKQVLFNLLANAIKFTNEFGTVELSARILNADQLEICVRDNGIGIRAQDIPMLFHAFQQLEHEDGRRRDGTGLGLAIVKQLIESQGGTVEVQSELGSGTTFRVLLPRVLRERAASTLPAR